MDLHELWTDDAQVVVDAAAGCRLASLCVNGLELLVGRSEDPLGWGCYPMVPWAGRLGGAHFHFDSDRHEVAPNLGPHAAHGLGFDQPWAVTSAGPNNLTSELQLGPPWPFGGRVVQHVELTPGRLVLTLDILADARPMPAMAGWHPWFNRRLDRGRAVELEVDPVAMYERDDRHLPTGRLVPPGPRPWDDCVTGMRADPILRWPEALELRLTSTCDSWVIYDEPDHAVCVEPQTGPPDEFNRSPVIAAPGRPLRAGFTLAWREL